MSQARFMSRLGIAVVAAVSAVSFASSSASAVQSGVVVTTHTGSGRPQLALSGGRIYVAWAGSSGTATAKELVLGSAGTLTDLTDNITKIPTGERLPQGTGPALDGERLGELQTSGIGAYLAWPDGTTGSTLTVAYYDGTALTCRTAFTGISTPYSPALAHDFSGHRYLAWTDPAGHLNVALLDSSGCATGHPMTLVNRTTLHDIAFAGPALGWDENTCCSFLGFMLGWVDRGGALRIASYDGTPVLKNRAVVGSPVKVTGAPDLTSMDSDNYVSWRGVDGNVYHAHSEGCTIACFSAPDQVIQDHGTGGVGVEGALAQAFFDTTGHLDLASAGF